MTTISEEAKASDKMIEWMNGEKPFFDKNIQDLIDAIIDRIKERDTLAAQNEEKQFVLSWLFNSHDTGISSKSLAAEFLGIDYKDRHAPRDPSDLGRCLRLIAAVPSIRGCVDTLALKNESWAKAALAWDIISNLMIAEVGISCEKGTSAPKTYLAMKVAEL